jgi:hypothetical protein
MHPRPKRLPTGLSFLLIAGCIWVPCLHFLFSRTKFDETNTTNGH